MSLAAVVIAGNGGDTADCWIWNRARTTAGYGTVGFPTQYVHRLSYETHVGPIPSGMHIDHLCRNRACWNPAHLEPVTLAENNRRASAVITHCPSGHAYTPDNLRKRARRDCATCHRIRERGRRKAES